MTHRFPLLVGVALAVCTASASCGSGGPAHQSGDDDDASGGGDDGPGGSAGEASDDSKGSGGSGDSSSGGSGDSSGSTGFSGSGATGSAPECSVESDCDDDDACTTDTCDDGTCSNADICDDGDACTMDTCDSQAECSNEPIDCDDGDTCTRDGCSSSDGCTNPKLDVCVATVPNCSGRPNEGFESNPNLAITGNEIHSDSIEVTGVDGTLWGVTATTNIIHTLSAEMNIWLISPDGTRIPLAMGRGAGNEDVFAGTTWGDDAAQWVGSATFSDNQAAPSLAPDGPLSSFRGESANGTWTLEIEDTVSTADDGRLLDWGLTLFTVDELPTENSPVSFETVAGVPIEDHTPLESPVTVSGGSDTLCRVDVDVSIAHTWPGDLEVLLEGPDGTTVMLAGNQGGGAVDAFTGTRFSDDSDELMWTTSFVSGVVAPSLKPSQGLDRFLGKPYDGTWTLHIVDDGDGDTGTFNSWNLVLTTCTC